MSARQDRFARKVAVVTGSASDVGRAIAHGLPVDGAWAVGFYPDMRSFRGPIGWNQRTQA
jgi:hypothetical protein